MKILILALVSTTIAFAISGKEKGLADSNNKFTIAAYYFPNYHTNDTRNITNKGLNWSEWELIKAAKPRFEGNDQPKTPLWGYTDEKDPKVMEQKIKAAIALLRENNYMVRDPASVLNESEL